MKSKCFYKIIFLHLFFIVIFVSCPSSKNLSYKIRDYDFKQECESFEKCGEEKKPCSVYAEENRNLGCISGLCDDTAICIDVEDACNKKCGPGAWINEKCSILESYPSHIKCG